MEGIVYVTDETSRHEITSWKVAETVIPPSPPVGTGLRNASWHVVVIVDHSGSMRTGDVPGYNNRLAAVYGCLARDLVEPQMLLGTGKVEISLIEMSYNAEIVLKRSAASYKLLQFLEGRAHSYAHSHGNYLPALDAALELLAGDAARQNQLFLVFLSDGAPSDHGCPYADWMCEHGYPVWGLDGQRGLQKCPVGAGCNASAAERVQRACVDRVKRIGDLLGRDRVYIGTVAFGPPSEDYQVLQSMAAALPRSSFQKLGLSASCLRTALSSLSSSLTTLRTISTGPRRGLTLRTDIAYSMQRQAYEEHSIFINGSGWDLYCGSRCLYKRRYDASYGDFMYVPLTDSDLARMYPYQAQGGVAHAAYKFAEGAERVVFQCTEVVSLDGGATAYCVGPRLVAKSTRFKEHLSDLQFHSLFCRTQGEAQQLAQLFNWRMQGTPEWHIRFLPCYVYGLLDRYNNQFEILVEEELEGKFTKWNDNAGAVKSGKHGGSTPHLGAISEDHGGEENEWEEDEEYDWKEGEEGEENEEDAWEEDKREEDEGDAREEEGDGEKEDEWQGEPSSGAAGRVPIEDVPQCFSHFTFVSTGGTMLVCDLQGVWNPVDGFTMTDPVIHHYSGSKREGATDKGPAGIRNFFSTHVCGPLCRRLGLPPPPRLY